VSFGLDLGDAQVYALLSNTSDVAGKWDWSAKIGQERMIRSENEIVGARLVEVCKEVHMTKHNLVVHMKFVQN
jgi:hypothetical protein